VDGNTRCCWSSQFLATTHTPLLLDTSSITLRPQRPSFGSSLSVLVKTEIFLQQTISYPPPSPTIIRLFPPGSSLWSWHVLNRRYEWLNGTVRPASRTSIQFFSIVLFYVRAPLLLSIVANKLAEISRVMLSISSHLLHSMPADQTLQHKLLPVLLRVSTSCHSALIISPTEPRAKQTSVYRQTGSDYETCCILTLYSVGTTWLTRSETCPPGCWSTTDWGLCKVKSKDAGTSASGPVSAQRLYQSMVVSSLAAATPATSIPRNTRQVKNTLINQCNNTRPTRDVLNNLHELAYDFEDLLKIWQKQVYRTYRKWLTDPKIRWKSCRHCWRY